MKSQNQNEKWIKEFRKLWGDYSRNKKDNSQGLLVENFIRKIITQTRKQDREAIREWAKENKKEVEEPEPICDNFAEIARYGQRFERGYNQALTDLLSFLDGLEGE